MVIIDILLVPWVRFVLPKLSHSYYIENAEKEIRASEFAQTEALLDYDQRSRSWKSIISFDEMKKQEEGECVEALDGEARSRFSA